MSSAVHVDIFCEPEFKIGKLSTELKTMEKNKSSLIWKWKWEHFAQNNSPKITSID